MKKLMIVASWKSNKILSEAEDWFKIIKQNWFNLPNWSNLEIVLAPPFTLLYPVKDLIEKNNLPITLCAQDVSPFPDGAYTGEISARMLKDLGVKYVLIGHSERRKYFHEDKIMLANKVREALDNNLTPIYCVSGESENLPEGVKTILYEPDFAIGSGKAGDPVKVNQIAKTFKENYGETIFLYGGSVNQENVASFCSQENIGGIGIGSGSLDPNNFLEIISHAAKI